MLDISLKSILKRVEQPYNKLCLINIKLLGIESLKDPRYEELEKEAISYLSEFDLTTLELIRLKAQTVCANEIQNKTKLSSLKVIPLNEYMEYLGPKDIYMDISPFFEYMITYKTLFENEEITEKEQLSFLNMNGMIDQLLKFKKPSGEVDSKFKDSGDPTFMYFALLSETFYKQLYAYTLSERNRINRLLIDDEFTSQVIDHYGLYYTMKLNNLVKDFRRYNQLLKEEDITRENK